MSMTSSISATIALIRMKMRLFWNGLRSWRWFYSTPLIVLLVVFLCFVIGQGIGGIFQSASMVIPQELVITALALMLVYGVILVFISDLLMGYTLNLGQMSTDHEYLCTLPISPSALLICKLFERLSVDWAAPVILLGGMLGMIMREGFSLQGLFIGTLLYSQIELLIGLFVTLLTVAFGRFFRPTTLRNLLAFLSYFGVIVGLGHGVWFSSINEQIIPMLIRVWANLEPWLRFPLKPARMLAETLMDGDFGRSFWHWQCFWSACFILGICFFNAMARAQWLTWVNSGISAPASANTFRLYGLIRKESLLLRNDMHLLLNALLLPLTIIFAEIYVLKDVFSLSQTSNVMNAMAAAVIYFCMFGPVNAVGSEGKGVSIIETLPIEPGRIIGQKTIFWGTIALIFFVPAALGIGWYLGLNIADRVTLVVWIAVFIISCVWAAVSTSAIFPDYDAKVLQMRSSLTGKIFACMIMFVCLPTKEASPSAVFAFLVFMSLALTLHYRACEVFSIRNDPDAGTEPMFRLIDAALPLACALGIQVVVGSVFHWVLYKAVFSFWPWLFASVPVLLVLARSLLLNVRRRFFSPITALGCRLPSIGLFIGALFTGLVAGYLGRQYLLLIPTLGFDPFVSNVDVWNWLAGFFGGSLATGVFFAALCMVASVIEEVFFRGFLDQALRAQGFTGSVGLLLNGACSALLHPILLLPPVFILSVFCTWMFRITGSLFPGMICFLTFNGITLWTLLMQQ
ncbi:MAG: CPBP family intramembrane metalloprotease [Candidatus Riflebacteria bacterium]|nr:CPBP family intramembrane metalloprotease [Candidatus Riflebacteria bacterium]